MRHGGRRRTRVRTRLAGLLLVPMAGAMVFAVGAARERTGVADRAGDVERLVEDARDKLHLRLALTNEAFSSGSAAVAHDLGVSVEQLGAVLGIDITGRIAADRTAVDAAFADIDGDPALDGARRQLDDLRAHPPETAGDLLAGLSAVQGAAAGAADASMDAANRATLGVPASTDLRRQLDLVAVAHQTATAVGVQLDGLSRLVVPGPDDQRQAGLDQLRLGVSLLDVAELQLDARATDEVAAAWAEARDADTSVRTAEAAARYARLSLPDVAPLPFDELGVLVADAMDRIDGYGRFADGVADNAAGIAADLRETEAAAAREAVLVALGVAVAGIGLAALFVRTLASPLRALAERANRLSAGDLAAVPWSGRAPREVVDVNVALDDAAATLRSVESSLDALAAGDVAAGTDEAGPPGRLGALVHQSMARLSGTLAEREALHHRLAHDARHDALTGLANRAAVTEAITQAAARSSRAGATLGVLVVELGGLKLVNSVHGHEAGDRVLRAAGDRLRQLVRAGDTVARIGATDFAVVAESTTPAGAAELGERLVAALATPVEIGAALTRVTVSVGIALALDGPVEAEALLRDGGLAAGRARHAGGNRVELYDRTMRDELLERAAVEDELTAAMAAGELTLHFQPVVTPQRLAVGAEALLRWQQPDGTLVPPGRFIPAAEASDLIIDIGRLVLADAAGRLARWQGDPELAAMELSVNLSGRHVLSLNVVDDVTRALEAAGADPGRLVVEVTETMVLSDFDLACDHLGRLRDAGVRIAVDDFGTGYTSLAHLRQLPADILKLDRSLIVAAAQPADERILDLVIGAAHASGMAVVAEGVETDEQFDLVGRLGCDHVQGFLVARPMPEPDFRATVARLGHPRQPA